MNFCSDIEIVNRIKNGTPADFKLLVDRYSDRIYNFLFAKSLNRNDIDDILQETFLKAYLNISTYKENYQFSTWLYTIAYHELCRFSGKRRSQKEQELANLSLIQNETQSINMGIWEEASQLSSHFYSVLWLKYHEEMDIKEIACIMKSSVAMVKINLFRARNQLKKILLDENNITEKKKKHPAIFLSHNSI